MTLTKKQEREKRWEEKQYRKLRATAEKKRRKGYLLVILALILLVDILDNLTTSMSGNMTSCFITEFFVNGQVFGRSYTYEEGLSLHNTISILGYALSLLSPFYKALADKFGRKPLFVFSTFGMAVGLLIIYFCKSYPVFLIGSFTTSFFLGHDIQILYILEGAPSNRRATIYSIVKGLGGLSSILIPMMRTSLMHNDATLWRNVYRLPGLCGLGIMLLVLIFGKDTHVYVDKRVQELSVPYEERLHLRRCLRVLYCQHQQLMATAPGRPVLWPVFRRILDWPGLYGNHFYRNGADGNSGIYYWCRGTVSWRWYGHRLHLY